MVALTISARLKQAIELFISENNIPVRNALALKWKVSRASKNGDSFAADVLRISIPVLPRDENENVMNDPDKHSEFNLIAKVAPKLKFRRDMYSIPILFQREMFMYNVLLPKFRVFQQRRLRADQPIFDNYPQLIGSSTDPFDEFILLTDICESGYKSFDRPTGVSLNVCKAILRNFARFHAISFVYKALDKEAFDALIGDNLRETLFVKEVDESFKGFMQSKVDLLRDKLKECPAEEIDTLADERLQVFREEYPQKMFEACHVEDYAVVCHGDSWISNFMYKVNNDQSLDVKLIDFQVARCTTPVVDLSYFLACSTDKQLRKALPELLLFYYNTLMEEIRFLGHDEPETLFPNDVFTDHCKKYMKFGFGMACMSLHSITCRSEDMPDVISLLETSSFEKMDEITKVLSKNPAYITRITDLVRDLVTFGYL